MFKIKNLVTNKFINAITSLQDIQINIIQYINAKFQNTEHKSNQK